MYKYKNILFSFTIGCILIPSEGSALVSTSESCAVAVRDIKGLTNSHLETAHKTHPLTANVLANFLEISKIFRASENEAAVRQHIIADAIRLGLPHRVDKKGNLLVTVPSTYKGAENKTPILLQGHLDLVAAVNGMKTRADAQEFMRQNGGVMPLEIRDGVIQSVGNRNSIGNDNGSAVAIMMEYMRNPDLEHGPLELLFTVEEEIGLKGAAELNQAEIPLRSKLALSLDSGDFNEALIGANGAARWHYKTSTLETEKITRGRKQLMLKLDGFKGGHSGVDIYLGRANPIVEMAEFTSQLRAQFPKLTILSFEGGVQDGYNKIPQEAQLQIAIHPKDEAELQKLFQDFAEQLRKKYKIGEKNTKDNKSKITATVSSPDKKATQQIAWSTVENVLELIKRTPNGPFDNSNPIWPSKYTDQRFSSNLAFLSLSDGAFQFGLMPRFYDPKTVKSFQSYLRSLYSSLMSGLRYKKISYSPEWQPLADSKMQKIVAEQAKALGFDELKFMIANGSVEPSQMVPIYPGLDIIVIGADTPNAHTEKEGMPLDSLAKTIQLTDAIVRELARRPE